MGMTILRPEQQMYVPDVQILRPRKTSAAKTWWDNNGAISGCVAAYAAKGAASLAASYTNLTGNTTYNAAPGVAPTWDATGGWTFNGTTQYLTTGVSPNTMTWSVLVRFSDCSGNNPLFGSVSNGATRFYLYPLNSGAAYFGYGNWSNVAGQAAASGVMGWAGLTPYKNGTALVPVITSGGSPSNRPVFLGAYNYVGVPAGFFTCKIQAFAIYSTTLSAGNVATITTAMQAL